MTVILTAVQHAAANKNTVSSATYCHNDNNLPLFFFFGFPFSLDSRFRLQIIKRNQSKAVFTAESKHKLSELIAQQAF